MTDLQRRIRADYMRDILKYVRQSQKYRRTGELARALEQIAFANRSLGFVMGAFPPNLVTDLAHKAIFRNQLAIEKMLTTPPDLTAVIDGVADAIMLLNQDGHDITRGQALERARNAVTGMLAHVTMIPVDQHDAHDVDRSDDGKIETKSGAPN